MCPRQHPGPGTVFPPADEKVEADDHVHPVVVDAAGHPPPYVKLVYIMRE